ncbi:MAG: hypothetical protein ACM3RX_02490 [Methanococcaceae archaeon]
MVEENKPEGNVTGGTGITSRGNVTIGDVSGQFAAGENISQVQTINKTDLKELRENLLEFQKGIDKLGLEPEDQNIVNGNISAAVKEAKKDEPQLSKIKEQLENANGVIKETGKTISSISELYEPAKKVFKALGIAASFLL